jgi:HlyD family secretion protein
MSPPPNEGLFRKVALERLSSPDRLDALLGLNRPQWPLVWAGCIVVAAATLYWGLQGRVAQKVAGRCVITSPGGVAEIAAGAAGQVASLGLKVGDRVSVGQEVARVLRPELYQQIEQAAERLTELERRLAEA